MVKCIHCFSAAAVEADHLIPKSWYPDTTPADLNRPTVPSCKTCNRKLGRIEGKLFFRFALMLDPDDPASSGLADRAIRSVDPSVGRNEQDTRSRDSQNRTLNKELFDGANLPPSSFLRGFEPNPAINDVPSLPFPETELAQFIRKLVKGIAYWDKKEYLHDPISFAYSFSDRARTSKIIDGNTLNLPPAFQITTAKLVSTRLVQASLWDSLRFIGVAYNPDGPDAARFVNWRHVQPET